MGGRGGNSGFTGKSYSTPSEAMNALYDYSNNRSDGMFDRWQKYGKDRLYVNMKKLYNIEIETYKNGNISSARMGGEKISNSEASKILSEKVYIDANTGKVYRVSNFGHGVREETKERLEKYVPKKIKKILKF